VKAIKTLESLGHPPKVIELDLVDDGPVQHEYLKKKTGQRTVPVIFLKGKFIGGNSELQKLHNDNKLQALL
jgi:glutaredoxin 3